MLLTELSHDKSIGQVLLDSYSKGKLVHAFIFAGGSTLSRSELGYAFGQLLIEGNLADLIVVKKPEDRASILVEQVEELQSRLKFKPVGNRHVVIIEEAQLMGTGAQNKLLKTLEEPSSDAVIMLLTDKTDSLLTTVNSRCTTYYLEDAPAVENPLLASAADVMVNLTVKPSPFYKKKACLEPVLSSKDETRQLASDFLEMYVSRLRNKLVAEAGKADEDTVKRLINAIERSTEASKYLAQLHNPSYTLKQLCLRI